MRRSGVIRQPAPRFLSLPVTATGKWSMWVMSVSVILLLLLTLVLLPAFESAPGFAVPHRILTSVTLLGIFSAGITAAIALLKRHERSWPLLLAVLLALGAAALMLGDILGSG